MRIVNVVVILMAGIVGPTTINTFASPPAARILSPQKGTQTAGLFDWLFGGAQDGESASPPEFQHRRTDDDWGQRERPRARRNESGAGTYRTLCVRLCDGFYFPISFATTRSRVREDAERCERQCPLRSRLYFHRNPDQTVDDMVDSDGQPYTKLPEAFRFRETYVAGCTCRGNPWDAESLVRHEAYARNSPPASAPTATAEKPKVAEPRRRNRQTNWGYRARRQDNADD